MLRAKARIHYLHRLIFERVLGSRRWLVKGDFFRQKLPWTSVNQFSIKLNWWKKIQNLLRPATVRFFLFGLGTARFREAAATARVARPAQVSWRLTGHCCRCCCGLSCFKILTSCKTFWGEWHPVESCVCTLCSRCCCCYFCCCCCCFFSFGNQFQGLLQLLSSVVQPSVKIDQPFIYFGTVFSSKCCRFWLAEQKCSLRI